MKVSYRKQITRQHSCDHVAQFFARTVGVIDPVKLSSTIVWSWKIWLLMLCVRVLKVPRSWQVGALAPWDGRRGWPPETALPGPHVLSRRIWSL